MKLNGWDSIMQMVECMYVTRDETGKKQERTHEI